MNIILLANQNWGVRSLQTLVHINKHNIQMVYTHPTNMDKHEKVWYESVKEACLEMNIPVLERTNLDQSDEEKIRALSPDVIFSIGWRRLIPKAIYSIPHRGTINIHEGLLPKYRGFAPTNWSIINGESEAGVTAHFVDEAADTGNIILQKKVTIQADDTAADLYTRTLELFPSMLTETLDLLTSNSLKPVQQKDIGSGFFCARRFPDDGRINWHQDRISIYNLIRALSDPYPNAFCYYKGQKLFIKRAQLIKEDYRGTPGRICAVMEKGIIVTCGFDHTKSQGILVTAIATETQSYKPKDFIFKLWDDLE